MHDVFLSYAREDRERALRIVDLLTHRGYSVWWDHNLIAGKNYGQQIEQVLLDARCVVVLWTRDSVGSDFVQDEARRGQEKLVPVLLDHVEPPVGFGRIQAVDLLGWSGETAHPGIEQLDAGIRECVGKPLPPTPARPRRWVAWVSLLAPSVVAVLAALLLARWPVATTVEADVLATRLEFHTTDALQPLFEAMPVHSLAVRGFEEVRVPKSGLGERFVLRPSGTDPARVSISGPELSIDGVSARSAYVTLDLPEPGSVGMTLRGSKVNAGVSLPAEVQMVTISCASDVIVFPSVIRLHIDPSDRLLEFSSGERALRLVLGLVADRSQPVFKADLAVDRVEFQQQTSTGEVKSTIQKGTIRFPDRWRADALEANDVLVLKDVRDFLIRRVELAGDALRVQLYGMGRVSYGPAGYLKRMPIQPVLLGTIVLAWLLLTWLMWRRFRHAIRL